MNQQTAFAILVMPIFSGGSFKELPTKFATRTEAEETAKFMRFENWRVVEVVVPAVVQPGGSK